MGLAESSNYLDWHAWSLRVTL